MELRYGSIVKVIGITSSLDDEVDTVILVNNITDGTKYNCKLLDFINI